MSTLAYPVDALIERLEAIALLKLVGIAPDLGSLKSAPPRVMPALFVLSETSGGAIGYSGPPLQQKRITRVVLLLWLRQHGSSAEAVRQMRELQEAVDARLAGWTPGDAFASLRFVSSRDEIYGNAQLVTRAVYEAAWDFIAPLQS